MADSAVIDVSKMKVVDLRKELKSRGLAHTGDKAELVARLQAAISQESHDDSAEINLDSDEIDSDAVLDEDDTLNGTVDEELALAENPPMARPLSPPKAEIKTSKLLKRKSITSESDKVKPDENKEAGGKKIVLHRVPVSAPATVEVPVSDKTESDNLKRATPEKQTDNDQSKMKITANLNIQSRLELRAKRFGLPVKVTDEERKAARMQRFGQNKNSAASITSGKTVSLGDLDKLKKRAERFGQNVSKVMSDIEMKERLEKRKAKFGVTK